MKSAFFIWLLYAIFLVSSFNSVLHAEALIVSAKTVENKIKQINDSTTVDEETRGKLLERYQQILELLDSEEKNRASAASYIRSVKELPEKTRAIRNDLEKQADKETTHALTQVTDETSLDDLEQVLLTEKANLAAVEAKNSESKQQLSVEANRAAKIRERLTEINKELDQIKTAAELQSADQSADMKQANKWLDATRTAVLQSEIEKLDQELLSQPIRLEHMTAVNELNRFKISWISNTIEQLEEMVNQRRDSQAREAIRESRQVLKQVTGKHILVQEQADINSKLSEEISNISLRLSRLSKQEADLYNLSKSIKNQFRNTKQKLKIAGLSPSLGPLLLKQITQLPDEHVFATKLEAHEEEITRVSLYHLQHKDELQQISDMDNYLDKLVNALPEQEQQAILPDLESLAVSRKALLEKLIDIEVNYIRSLDNVNFTANKLQDVVSEYRTLLKKQLFWMRSSSVISWESINSIPGHVLEFLSKDKWIDLFQDFMSSL